MPSRTRIALFVLTVGDGGEESAAKLRFRQFSQSFVHRRAAPLPISLFIHSENHFYCGPTRNESDQQIAAVVA